MSKILLIVRAIMASNDTTIYDSKTDRFYYFSANFGEWLNPLVEHVQSKSSEAERMAGFCTTPIDGVEMGISYTISSNQRINLTLEHSI